MTTPTLRFRCVSRRRFFRSFFSSFSAFSSRMGVSFWGVRAGALSLVAGPTMTSFKMEASPAVPPRPPHWSLARLMTSFKKEASPAVSPRPPHWSLARSMTSFKKEASPAVPPRPPHWSLARSMTSFKKEASPAVSPRARSHWSLARVDDVIQGGLSGGASLIVVCFVCFFSFVPVCVFGGRRPGGAS